MRVFKNAWFQRFARAERGLVDADLGGGKSGGYRALVFFRAGARAVFVFGFAKSDRANIDKDDEATFRKAAKIVLGFSDEQMDAEAKSGRLTEIDYNEEKLQE